MALGCGDIKELAKLLNAVNPDGEEESSSDDDEGATKTKHSAKLGPGSVGPPKKQEEQGDAQKAKVDKKPKPDEIWGPEETELKSRAVAYDIDNDPREKPKYEMYFRQAVCTEDIYLQLGNKTPGTASCENLVVEIELPGEDFKKVNLDIKPDHLFLRSPKYVFRLALPHPADPNGGNAKWDQSKEKLTVTLKLVRELDGLNF